MELTTPCKTYHSGHSIVYSCQFHVIFCPKYQRAVLQDGVDIRLKELVLERQEQFGYTVLDMEVMPDHIHMVLDVDPRVGIHKVVSQIKGYTAHTLREEFLGLRSRLPCLWTRSKFVSTVGAVTLDVVKQYIADQKGK